MDMQLSMRHLMLKRKVTVPASYEAVAGCLVSYELPLLKHCFILCATMECQLPSHQVQVFFLAEAARLATEITGDAQAYVFIYSGSRVRKRQNLHAHVFVVTQRWQKTWVYALLATKNFALLLQSSVYRAFKFQ